MGFGKDNKGAIVWERRTQVLTTLADGTALIIGTKLAITDDFRMLKAQLKAFVDNITAGEAGGLLLGLANGDLTEAQIGDCIEAAGPLNKSDRDKAELAERAVFIVSQLAPDGGSDATFKGEHGGPIVEAKPRWTFTKGVSWNWFVYNSSGAALTTGAIVHIVSKNFGLWL